MYCDVLVVILGMRIWVGCNGARRKEVETRRWLDGCPTSRVVQSRATARASRPFKPSQKQEIMTIASFCILELCPTLYTSAYPRILLVEDPFSDLAR